MATCASTLMSPEKMCLFQIAPMVFVRPPNHDQRGSQIHLFSNPHLPLRTFQSLGALSNVYSSVPVDVTRTADGSPRFFKPRMATRSPPALMPGMPKCGFAPSHSEASFLPSSIARTPKSPDSMLTC